MFSIAPSLMCADLLQLGAEVRELEQVGVEVFHLDVMDGHFVPNLGLSFDLVKQIRGFTSVPLDLHLMVEHPELYVSTIAPLKIDFVSFHIESSGNPIRLARAIRAVGAKVGLAFNPATPVSALEYLVGEIDFVLVMTVEPGFAGQSFIPSMYEKISAIGKTLKNHCQVVPIEVDGNLNAETSARCIENGASILVGGSSSVFRRKDTLKCDCASFRKEVEMRVRSSSRLRHSLGVHI